MHGNRRRPKYAENLAPCAFDLEMLLSVALLSVRKTRFGIFNI